MAVSMSPLELVLSRLEGVRQHGDSYQTRCSGEGHEDRQASLSVSEGKDGRVILHCHAGCTPETVVAGMGLKMAHLFPPKSRNGKTAAPSDLGEIVATYDYRDEKGELLYQAVRYDPKDFRQRRPDGRGGWEWKTGARKVLYRLPEIIAAETVYVPEGERDVDNLATLGLAATCNVGGAGKWKGNSYFEALLGKKVVILPDNDKPGRDHAAEVANDLCIGARSVRIVELPGLPEKGDVSDWLAAGGTRERLEELVSAAPEWGPEGAEEYRQERERRKAEGEDAGDGVSKTRLLADAITAVDHFAQDVGGRLYVFREGAWSPDGETHVLRRVHALTIQWAAEMSEDAPAWTSHRAREVVQYIQTPAPTLWEQPKLTFLNVRNGILRTKTRELDPPSPLFLSPVQLPVVYDPEATCPEWERFITTTFPEDAQEVAWQLVAWLMLPDTSIQKAVLLTGEGSNGKSTFLAGLTAFLGKQNTVSLSLQKMEGERFAAARLLGKLANICPDLPSSHLSDTSTFKAITGGDYISAEFKHKPGFDFLPFARLIFSANHPPQSSDSSHAFFRRWLVVPFHRTFEGDAIPRRILDAKLSAPSELSGLLNRALDALPGLREHGFTESQSMRDAWLELRRTTDPLSVWLDRETVDRPEASVVKRALHQAYNADCAKHGRAATADNGFARALRRLRPGITSTQKTIDARVEHVWFGIGLRGQIEAPPASQASRVSQVFSNMQLDTRGAGESRDRESPERGDLALAVACRAEPVKPVKPVNDPTPELDLSGEPDDGCSRVPECFR